MKQCRPKISGSIDFLGCGHPWEVVTAGIIVAIVQDSFYFVDGQILVEYGVEPTSIQDVTDEEVSRGMMENAPTIVSRDMSPKLLCLKVDE
jgi:hypothetical protein